MAFHKYPNQENLRPRGTGFGRGLAIDGTVEVV